MNIKLTTNKVAVDLDYPWQQMHDCPANHKVQLLTKGGTAIYGEVTPEERFGYEGWAPVPSRRILN